MKIIAKKPRLIEPIDVEILLFILFSFPVAPIETIRVIIERIAEKRASSAEI